MANRADREHPGRDQQEHRHDEQHLRVELQGTREEQQLQDDDASMAPMAAAVASRTDRVGGSHPGKASATGMSVRN